jgi:hypothetical protein
MSGLHIESVNFDELTADPVAGDLEDGQVWHNKTADAWKGRQAGVTRVMTVLDAAAGDNDLPKLVDASQGRLGDSDWAFDGNKYLYPKTNGLHIGVAANRVGRLFTDEVRVYIDGASDAQLISNAWRRADGSGQHLLANLADNPQLLMGAAAMSGSANLDANNGAKLYLNALQDGDVIVGAGDLYSEDAGTLCGTRSFPWDEVHGAHMWTITAIKTTSYTAAKGEVVRCNTAGGGFNVTLPAATDNEGAEIVVIKTGADGNAVTVLPTGGDTIHGGASSVINGARESETFVSDGGTDWKRVSVNTSTGSGGGRTLLVADDVEYSEKKTIYDSKKAFRIVNDSADPFTSYRVVLSLWVDGADEAMARVTIGGDVLLLSSTSATEELKAGNIAITAGTDTLLDADVELKTKDGVGEAHLRYTDLYGVF